MNVTQPRRETPENVGPSRSKKRPPWRTLLLTSCAVLLPALAGARGGPDPDPQSLRASRLASEKVALSARPLAADKSTVRVGPERRPVSLRQLARRAFARQDEIRKGLADLGKDSPLLFGEPRFVDQVYELPGAHMIVAETHLVVADPAGLQRRIPGLPLAPAKAGKVGSPSAKSGKEPDFDPESSSGFETFKEKTLPLLPAGHPLRQAAARGDEALIEALSQGQGDLVLRETLVVAREPAPAENGRLRIPRFEGGSFQYHQTVEVPVGVRDEGRFTRRTMPEPAAIQVTAGAGAGFLRKFVVLQSDMDDPGLGLEATAASRPDHAGGAYRFERMGALSQRYRLKTGFDGRYVAVDPRSGVLTATARAADAGAVFTVRRSGRDSTLAAGGRFVTLRDDGVLAATARSADTATRFRWLPTAWKPRITAAFIASPRIEKKLIRSELAGLRVHVLSRGDLDTLSLEASSAHVRTSPLDYGQVVTLVPSHPELVFDPPQMDVAADRNAVVRFEMERKVDSEGEIEWNTSFLAGETLGGSWEWEREWTYWSGHFRFTVGAGLGVGLRIPIEVSGVLTPEYFRVNAEGAEATARVAVDRIATPDAGASFYTDVGLGTSQVFDGDEFVLEGRATFGLSFRALWKTWVHIPTKSHGLDVSRDFEPPWSGPSDAHLEVPTQATGSKLDLGVLSGFVQLGVRLRGDDGQVGLDYAFDDGPAEPLAFPRDDGELSHTFRPRGDAFDFSLSRPTYRMRLSAAPEVRWGISVGVETTFYDFKRSFTSDWLALSALELPLGALNLERHHGTRQGFEVEGRVLR